MKKGQKMDDLQDVYNDLIMEHSMNSYNKKKLETCDLCEMGHNPNCGCLLYTSPSPRD